MKSSTSFLCALVASLFFFSCQSEKATGLAPLSLLPYGFPLTIMAPDSAKVKEDPYSTIIKEITIKGKGGYHLVVKSAPVTEGGTSDPSAIKAAHLEEAKANRYFSRIIQDDEHGYIFESRMDSTDVRYDFFAVKVMGDKEYNFEGPYAEKLDLGQAEWIYNSIGDTEK